MDDLVKQAMFKWPNVPACFGWLGLDIRGNWYLRDDHAQSAGGFTCGLNSAKGSMLTHGRLIEFINRNYGVDGNGQWYFQNGPQRVYVELASTPWIWRVNEQHCITSHCGHLVEFRKAVSDEYGWIYLETSLGFGLVHSQDVLYASNALANSDWTTVEPICHADIERLYNFQRSPQKRKPI